MVRYNEAASSDMKAVEEYIKHFKELMDKENSSHGKSSTVMRLDSFWKKMPRRNFITVEEMMMLGHKPMKG